MHVLITGATGYIGSAVARRLLARGHTVTGLVRSDASAAKLAAAGIRTLKADLEDTASVRAASAKHDFDALIHTGFSHDDWTRMDVAFEADHRAVAAMLDGLAEAGSATGAGRAFVFTSGSGVLGDTGRHPADESAPTQNTGMLAQRVATEQLVLASGAGSNPALQRAIVLRPGLVYGRGGGGSAMLLVGLARGADGPQTVGSGENVWSAVHIDDVAELYVLALEGPLGANLYHCASAESLDFRAIAVAAAKGGPRPAVVPADVVAMSPDEARRSFGPLGDGLLMEKRISAAKAHAELGWVPARPSFLAELELGSYAQRPAGQATAINSFRVPAEASDKFLDDWHRDLDFMAAQPGAAGGTLYRSVDDRAHFRFVNVARWSSQKDFEAARDRITSRIRNEDGGRQASWSSAGIEIYPGLYTAEKNFYP